MSSTLHAIAKTYKSKTGLQTEEKELLQRLSETEKTGIIESTIANIQDEPTYIWRTKMTPKSREHKRLNRWNQTITPRLK
jgi:hypothetical protein